MKTKAAWAAFAFIAVAVIGTVTNWLIVPAELMAVLILLSACAALIVAASEGSIKEAGSGWLLGLTLSFGLLCLVAAIGSLFDY